MDKDKVWRLRKGLGSIVTKRLKCPQDEPRQMCCCDDKNII